ncbi:hypothetical protein ACJMK2_006275, partial [Sinanodonta woodiana]
RHRVDFIRSLSSPVSSEGIEWILSDRDHPLCLQKESSGFYQIAIIPCVFRRHRVDFIRSLSSPVSSEGIELILSDCDHPLYLQKASSGFYQIAIISCIFREWILSVCYHHLYLKKASIGFYQLAITPPPPPPPLPCIYRRHRIYVIRSLLSMEGAEGIEWVLLVCYHPLTCLQKAYNGFYQIAIIPCIFRRNRVDLIRSLSSPVSSEGIEWILSDRFHPLCLQKESSGFY